MSRQQSNIAQAVRIPTGGHADRGTGATLPQSDLTLDLAIIEAGLRLKVLPLRDAIARGRKLSFSEVERRARRLAFFALCGNARLSIVDVGLFADAVARRPDVAQRLWRALHPTARR
ncbi:hypothetical protein BMS3Bbin10_00337 [bacterium BMS3Bbin10]|nr:hypothetical protein BMS3Bbin10_00337 [bacterium BMS3Bbin10]